MEKQLEKALTDAKKTGKRVLGTKQITSAIKDSKLIIISIIKN